MFWKTFLHRPQQLTLRKLLFQIHMWVGIGVGLYIFLISITGAALVFRDELVREFSPQLFRVASAGERRATIPRIVQAVKTAYPESQLAGIYSPTATRHAFLAYVSGEQRFVEVLVHPITAEVLGQLPERSFWHWLQDLHFNLLTGGVGRIVNGVGGLFVVVMCMTGIVIWWPGAERWSRALKIDFGNNWKRVNWDLHSAAGFWTLAFVFMWGLTGAYFAWPQEFRAAVNWFSPITRNVTPASDAALKGHQPVPDIQDLIATAQMSSPGREFWGIIFPLSERATFQVTTARIAGRNEWDNTDHIDFYFDQYSGKLLQESHRLSNTAGDVVMSWIVPLHFGTFGQKGVKTLWLIFGLAPSLLFVTGSIIWWNRVLSEKWAKLRGKATASAPHVTAISSED